MPMETSTFFRVFRVVILTLAIPLSVAVIVLSIYIDVLFAKDYNSVHTSFLVLLVTEFLFLFTYFFWALFQWNYTHVITSLREKQHQDDVTFHASAYSRHFIFSLFAATFCVVSLGASIAIINLSIQSGTSGSHSFFSESHHLLLVLSPLMFVCQFSKGTLIATDAATIVLSQMALLQAQETYMSFFPPGGSNLSRSLSDNFIGPKYSQTIVDGASPQQNAGDRVLDAQGHLTVQKNAVPNESFEVSVSESVYEIDANGGGVKKTLVKSPLSNKRLTLHSVNMTPPLSSHSFCQSPTNEENASQHSAVPLAFPSSVSDHSNDRNSGNFEGKRVGNISSAPRSRSALSLRLGKKQLSPIHEPCKKPSTAESPTSKKGKTVLLPDETEDAKQDKKIKYKNLNNLLLDNFEKDFNQLLSASQKQEPETTDNSMEKYKRVLKSKNQKNLRISVLRTRDSSLVSPKSDSGRSSLPVPSSPPPDLPQEEEYSNKLKPLYLAKQLAKNTDQMDSVNTLYLTKDLDQTLFEGTSPKKLAFSEGHTPERFEQAIDAHIDSLLHKECRTAKQKPHGASPGNVSNDDYDWYESPMSWDSNYDPLYENDLEAIPSIPTNTLWPFNRGSMSPKFSPTRAVTSPVLSTDTSHRQAQKKGMRHISLEEWSTNSKEWMHKDLTKTAISPATSFRKKTSPSERSFRLAPSNNTSTISEVKPLNINTPLIPTKHKADDSFTFEKENDDASVESMKDPELVTPPETNQYSFQPIPVMPSLSLGAPEFKFPNTKKLVFADGSSMLDLQDTRRGRNLLKRKHRSRSYSPVKTDPQQLTDFQPLLSYTKAEINILNNLRGEKRKNLLKLNKSEPSSPKKNGKRSRSPLKRISATFHESKRSTVIFDDDFNFEMEKELINNNGDLNLELSEKHELKSPVNLLFQDSAENNTENYDVHPIPESSPFNIARKKKKNFSINSLKSMMNHLHHRSLSTNVDFMNPTGIETAPSPAQRVRHKSLDYRISLSGNKLSKWVHLDNNNPYVGIPGPNSKSHPVKNYSESWDWKFVTNETPPNKDDSLINDVIQNSKDYDYNFNNNSDNSSSGEELTMKKVESHQKFLDVSQLSSSTPLHSTNMTISQSRNSLGSNKISINREDSYGLVSDKSLVSTVPSGYIGEYDKEKWMTIKSLNKVH